ncbi:tRNA(Met) cytidine acetyltransferase [Alteromonas sp. 5E99-2]|uniref:GNAT family N-acetyltransferase n=1 Tax=Alteromonas sp. 5E99-2 TaxID=2817683 RepID=UPI001A982A54|nr:GNAT family N-acetyltransferase [Alteromonas sp. 5E99-2]MBO1255168.1 tRNA(Met) cytidine acetyltransferase [Alteromonas sp. 5E99-2]
MYLWENWFNERQQGQYHRKLILLSGDKVWTDEQAIRLSQSTEGKSIWVGDTSVFTTRGVPTKQFKKLLGQECLIGLYDAQNGISPSALLALSGTIKENGVLVVCCPRWSQWPSATALMQSNLISHGYSLEHSLFIERWQEMISKAEDVFVYEQDKNLVFSPCNKPVENPKELNFEPPFASGDQQNAFSILSNLKQNENAVITARRGRGKSALLGLIADYYVNEGRTVYVCTSLKSNATSIFKHVANKKQVKWYAPDSPELLDSSDLLLIDEAASLPIKEVLRLTRSCNQYILATTTEGYEGTATGFKYKLLPKLKNKSSQIREITLHQPLRYCSGDSLELHLDCLFLLNSTIHNVEVKPNKECSPHIEIIKNKQDVSAEKLRQWFSILSLAHYQTTPEDIIRTLDSPDNFFIVLYQNNSLIGVAIVIEEGGNRLQSLAQDIASGARRAKGHLLAQKLSLHLSDDTILTRKIWRINRIAVSPQLQNKGFGTAFLRQIEEHAYFKKVDLMGASFAASNNATRFWIQNGYTPFHLGSVADKSTGEVSLAVVKTIRPRVGMDEALLLNLFVYESPRQFRNETISELCEQTILTSSNIERLEEIFLQRILDYINDSRSHNHMGKAISYWLEANTHRIKQVQPPTKNFSQLLTRRWIDVATDQELLKDFKINGRKKLYKSLKESFCYYYWELNIEME